MNEIKDPKYAQVDLYGATTGLARWSYVIVNSVYRHGDGSLHFKQLRDGKTYPVTIMGTYTVHYPAEEGK